MQVSSFKGEFLIARGRKADIGLIRGCQSLGNTMRGKYRLRIMYVIPKCGYGYGEVMLLIMWCSRFRSCEEGGRGFGMCRCGGVETASWCRLRIINPEE